MSNQGSDSNVVEEDDEDLEPSSEQSESLDLSTNERRLVTQPYDLGVKGIVDDIDQGRISLNIQYQRQYVWDRGKASRLIESLLLNIPIPVCYFAEDENGIYEVIDGLQRLTTITSFLRNELTLTGLPVLSELEGTTYDELSPRDRRRLENRTIRCIVITEDSHPDIKFDLFERLNTGAAMLTAQELRNSVYRGPFNDSIKDLASQEYLTNLVGPSSNRRMDLEELILRFFALFDGLPTYKPPLRQFLNQYMRSHRNEPADPQIIEVFRDSCETLYSILGSAPFRLPGSKNTLNKAMFDSLMIPIAHADRHALREHGEEFEELMKTLPAEGDFTAAVGRATADRQRMLYRIGRVAEALNTIGVPVHLPQDLLGATGSLGAE